MSNTPLKIDDSKVETVPYERIVQAIESGRKVRIVKLSEGKKASVQNRRRSYMQGLRRHTTVPRGSYIETKFNADKNSLEISINNDKAELERRLNIQAAWS